LLAFSIRLFRMSITRINSMGDRGSPCLMTKTPASTPASRTPGRAPWRALLLRRAPWRAPRRSALQPGEHYTHTFEHSGHTETHANTRKLLVRAHFTAFSASCINMESKQLNHGPCGHDALTAPCSRRERRHPTTQEHAEKLGLSPVPARTQHTSNGLLDAPLTDLGSLTESKTS